MMKRSTRLIRSNFSLSLAIALVCVRTAAAQEHKPSATLAELQQRLTEHVSQLRFAAAMWGVKVVSLDSGKTLFESNPQKLFSPASNSKLYTVALALDRLGPDFKIRTSLYSNSKPTNDSVLHDNL